MKQMNRLALLMPFLLSFPLFSCQEVRLIGAYDETINSGIQAVSKELSTIFVKIDKAIDNNSNWSYPSFEPDYIAIESELSALTIRANALPKYKIILDQLNLLSKSVKALEADHRSGFVARGAPVADLKKAISVDQSAIATSISAMLTLQEGLKRESVSRTK